MIGINIGVLEPGQPASMYHRENDQEDFLVLSGECLAIIEGSERPLRAWDFVHCPPGTEHIFVGAGDGPLANLGLGAVHPGVAACSIGTSGALRLMVESPVVDPQRQVFCYALLPGRWIVGGGTQVPDGPLTPGPQPTGLAPVSAVQDGRELTGSPFAGYDVDVDGDTRVELRLGEVSARA